MTSLTVHNQTRLQRKIQPPPARNPPRSMTPLQRLGKCNSAGKQISQLCSQTGKHVCLAWYLLGFATMYQRPRCCVQTRNQAQVHATQAVQRLGRDMFAQALQVTTPICKWLLTGTRLCLIGQRLAQRPTHQSCLPGTQALRKTALARRVVIPWGSKAPLAPPAAATVEPPPQVHGVRASSSVVCHKDAALICSFCNLQRRFVLLIHGLSCLLCMNAYTPFASKLGARHHSCLLDELHALIQEVKLPPGIEPLVLWEPAEDSAEEPVVVDTMLARWLRPHQREGVQFLFDCVTGLRSDIGQGEHKTSELVVPYGITVKAQIVACYNVALQRKLHLQLSCNHGRCEHALVACLRGFVQSETHRMQVLFWLTTWASARHCKASLCCGPCSTQAMICWVASLSLSVSLSAAQPVSSATGTVRSRSGSRYTISCTMPESVVMMLSTSMQAHAGSVANTASV